jgi:hypothetical protein
MIKKAFIKIFAVLLLVISILSAMQVEVVEANPTWGKPGTPIPPITDPPQIIINYPNNGEYNNPVPITITIILPDSWVPEQGIDSASKLVGGRNTLRSITCTIDGQSIILWNGTRITPYGITYFMPKVSQFSADMTVGKGQHSLQVSVLALSQYRTEGIVPFSDREYLISANQSTTFTVIKASDDILSPTIDNIKNPYPFQQKTLNLPPSTPAPNPNPIIINPNSSNSALQSDFLSHNAFPIAMLSVFGIILITLMAVFYKKRIKV